MPMSRRSFLPRRLVLPLSAFALVVGVLTATGVAAEQYAIDLLDGTAYNVDTEYPTWVGDTYRITPPDDDAAVPPTAPVVAAISPAPVQVPPLSVPAMIADAADTFGLDAGRMERIARCESGLRADAKGDYDRNGVPQSLGIFQIQAALWSTTPQGKAGLSRLDAQANISAAGHVMKRDGYGAWSCK